MTGVVGGGKGKQRGLGEIDAKKRVGEPATQQERGKGWVLRPRRVGARDGQEKERGNSFYLLHP